MQTAPLETLGYLIGTLEHNSNRKRRGEIRDELLRRVGEDKVQARDQLNDCFANYRENPGCDEWNRLVAAMYTYQQVR